MERQASGHSSLCMALDEWLTPPTIVVLRGLDAPDWQRRLAARYRPHTLALRIADAATALPAALAKPIPAHGVNAWVCRGVECLPAITGLDQLLTTLTAARR